MLGTKPSLHTAPMGFIFIKCLSHKQASNIVPDHMTHPPRGQALGSASTTNPHTKTVKLAENCRLGKLHKPGRSEGSVLASRRNFCLGGKTGELRTDTSTALCSLSGVILLETPPALGGGKRVTGKEMKVQCPTQEHTAGCEEGMWGKEG